MPGKDEQKYIFKKLQGGFKVDSANLLFHVVSMVWFKKWEAYVGIAPTDEKLNEASDDVPGPINSSQ